MTTAAGGMLMLICVLFALTEDSVAFFSSAFFWQSIFTIFIIAIFLVFIAFEGVRANAETSHFL